MVSGLKVNFFRSCLIGVNVDTEFMDMACTFMNCGQCGAVYVFGPSGGCESYESVYLGTVGGAIKEKAFVIGK